MKLIAWGRSDTGRKRDHNEDSFLIDEDTRLFAVADGMGGHQGGETASRMALEVMQRLIADSMDELDDVAARLEAERIKDLIATRELRGMGRLEVQTEWQERMERAPTAPMEDYEPGVVRGMSTAAATVMRAAATEAGIEIFGASLQDPNLRGMGTTLTAMLYDDGHMHLIHAGDSRAYLFRDNRLLRLTEDHSWIAEQVRRGAMTQTEAKESKYRHVITRSVGFEREVDLDTGSVSVQPGDCFLLCSDGMYNYIEDEEIERLLRITWCARVPGLFIDIANERGGDDNITVVVVQTANQAS